MKKAWVVVLLGAWLLVSCGKGMPAENTPGVTVTPSRTPRPTFTPVITPTPFLTPEVAQFKLPAWLGDPGDHVLLSVAQSEPGESDHILLANADNGEQFQADVTNFR